MPIEELPNARIRFELRGSAGDPTVLIHGAWVDHRTWDLVVPGLSHSLDVLTYDRRGYGESTGAPRAHPVADDTEDLAALLEATNHFPAHLVAHSYGGAVAVLLAVERPELVRSLTLHEPPFIGLLVSAPESASEGEFILGEARRLQRRARAGYREGALREAMDAFTLEPGGWDRLPPHVRESFVRNVDRWVEELDDPEALDPDPKRFAEVLVPALLTYGTQSPGYLQRITQLLGRQLDNSTVQPIPDAGHAPHLTRPAQFIATVQMFLVERNVPVN